MVFPLVLLIIFGYETYVVSRLLALALLLYLGFHIVIARYPFKLNLCAMAVASFCVGLGLLKLSHGDMTFDMQLFRGDGESLVNFSLQRALGEAMKRFSELPMLFLQPVHSHFETWFPAEKSTGWLEIWILLAVVMSYLVYLMIRGKLPLEKLMPKNFEIGFLLAASIASVMIPLGSYHMIRGHRFFALYIATTILAGFLIHLALGENRGKGRAVVFSLVILMGGAILAHRLPMLLDFKQGGYKNNERVFRVIKQMQRKRVIALEEPSNALICNHRKAYTDNLQFDRPTSWTAILYASHFACASNISDITLGDDCDCREEMKDPEHQSNLCVGIADSGG